MPRAGEPLSDLDKVCIRALANVSFGLNKTPERIERSLKTAMERSLEVSAKQRRALYAICWRYRKQLNAELVPKITIALAELASVAAFEQYESEAPRIRVCRADAGDLFSQ